MNRRIVKHALLAGLCAAGLTLVACSGSSSGDSSPTTTASNTNMGGPSTTNGRADSGGGSGGGSAGGGGGDYMVDLTLTGATTAHLQKSSGIDVTDEQYGCNQDSPEQELHCSFHPTGSASAGITLEGPVQVKSYVVTPEPTDDSASAGVGLPDGTDLEPAGSGASNGTVVVTGYRAAKETTPGEVSGKLDFTVEHDSGDQSQKVHVTGSFTLPIL